MPACDRQMDAEAVGQVNWEKRSGSGGLFQVKINPLEVLSSIQTGRFVPSPPQESAP